MLEGAGAVRGAEAGRRVVAACCGAEVVVPAGGPPGLVPPVVVAGGDVEQASRVPAAVTGGGGGGVAGKRVDPADDRRRCAGAAGQLPAPVSPEEMVTVTAWVWTSVDGSRPGYVRQRPCQRVPGGPDGLGPLACDSSFGAGQSQGPAGRTLPTTYAQMRKLPADPRRFLAYLRRVSGGSGRLVIWADLTDILRWIPAVPPAQAAAIFTAASQLPGSTLLSHVTDAAGRAEVGVVMVGDPSRVELIFNPKTYQLEGIDTARLTRPAWARSRATAQRQSCTPPW